MDKINIRGVNFDNVTMDEALSSALSFISSEGAPGVIHTPNAEIVQLCAEKPEYYPLINSADIIIPDGAGVILASKILRTPLKKGRVPGIELGEKIIERAAADGFGVYLLGGKPGVAQAAAEKLTAKYPGLRVCGVHDGYFADDAPVIEDINRSGAAFLAVCLGVPKQEEWMARNRDKLNVRLMAGLGGSLDGYAGIVKRAPKIFRKTGMEWLYRLIKEPKRIGRMMKLPKFVLGTLLHGNRGAGTPSDKDEK